MSCLLVDDNKRFCPLPDSTKTLKNLQGLLHHHLNIPFNVCKVHKYSALTIKCLISSWYVVTSSIPLHAWYRSQCLTSLVIPKRWNDFPISPFHDQLNSVMCFQLISALKLVPIYIIIVSSGDRGGLGGSSPQLEHTRPPSESEKLFVLEFVGNYGILQTVF